MLAVDAVRQQERPLIYCHFYGWGCSEELSATWKSGQRDGVSVWVCVWECVPRELTSLLKTLTMALSATCSITSFISCRRTFQLTIKAVFSWGLKKKRVHLVEMVLFYFILFYFYFLFLLFLGHNDLRVFGFSFCPNFVCYIWAIFCF